MGKNCSDCVHFKACEIWYGLFRNTIDTEENRTAIVEYGYDFKADKCKQYYKESD